MSEPSLRAELERLQTENRRDAERVAAAKEPGREEVQLARMMLLREQEAEVLREELMRHRMREEQLRDTRSNALGRSKSRKFYMPWDANYMYTVPVATAVLIGTFSWLKSSAAVITPMFATVAATVALAVPLVVDALRIRKSARLLLKISADKLDEESALAERQKERD